MTAASISATVPAVLPNPEGAPAVTTELISHAEIAFDAMLDRLAPDGVHLELQLGEFDVQQASEALPPQAAIRAEIPIPEPQFQFSLPLTPALPPEVEPAEGSDPAAAPSILPRESFAFSHPESSIAPPPRAVQIPVDARNLSVPAQSPEALPDSLFPAPSANPIGLYTPLRQPIPMEGFLPEEDEFMAVPIPVPPTKTASESSVLPPQEVFPNSSTPEMEFLFLPENIESFSGAGTASVRPSSRTPPVPVPVEIVQFGANETALQSLSQLLNFELTTNLSNAPGDKMLPVSLAPAPSELTRRSPAEIPAVLGIVEQLVSTQDVDLPMFSVSAPLETPSIAGSGAAIEKPLEFAQDFFSIVPEETGLKPAPQPAIAELPNSFALLEIDVNPRDAPTAPPLALLRSEPKNFVPTLDEPERGNVLQMFSPSPEQPILFEPADVVAPVLKKSTDAVPPPAQIIPELTPGIPSKPTSSPSVLFDENHTHHRR